MQKENTAGFFDLTVFSFLIFCNGYRSAAAEECPSGQPLCLYIPGCSRGFRPN